MNEIKRAASEEKIRYVEGLASAEEYEGDYWLTLTDAARVTKRQDKTIRDWVQQGKLAVRPVHLGINKRTRQVRASDLAQLTPILDQTAAITTEAGQIYLTSIPGEMQQIRTTHEELLTEATRLQQEIERQGQTFQERLTRQQEQQQRDLEALSATWRQQWELMSTQTQEAFERIGQRLVQQQDQQRQDLETLSSTWTERLDKTHETMYTLRDGLSLRLDEHQSKIQQLVADRDALRMTLERERQDREAFQQAIRQEMTAALARQDQERIQLQHDLLQEIQAAAQQQQAVLEQQAQAFDKALALQAQKSAHEMTQMSDTYTTLAQQVQHIAERLDTVHDESEGVADRLTHVEQAIERQEQAATAAQAQLTRDLQQLSARVLAFQTQQTQDRSHKGHEGGD